MKKDWHIALFTLVYVLVFPLIYALGFHDLRGFVFFMLILMVLSAPSLFAVLILLAFERTKKRSISIYVYIILSIVLFSIFLIIWKNVESDPKNIFPIFEESHFVHITMCIASHIIALITIELVKTLNRRHDAT
ncbi:hypothetical protein [uncultured Psychroserpens sp.]|uniref:hypothetical protein n=1 Tax=uncultured Psychroserpens sp. TaxID=255436 RepID=UPI0026258543|nr:hypothetical protein [uncultured Psychroserpens sp.]